MAYGQIDPTRLQGDPRHVRFDPRRCVLPRTTVCCSEDRFLLLGRRNSARSGLGLGLRQQSEARLAPGEVYAHIEQCIGPPAGAGELHDRHDTVGLSGSEGHRPSGDMIGRCVDA